MWNRRLAIALFAYAVLALLVWRTMHADNIRLVTWAILGLFAVRTIVQAAREEQEQLRDGIENERE
jgi:hypothetical protein